MVAAMSRESATRRLKQIERRDFMETPYTCKLEFVKDVAALAVEHKDQMRRKLKGGSTIWGSLCNATSALELGYLFNGPRFLARANVSKPPYGTTGVEALHAELVLAFGAVKQLTRSYARIRASVFTLRKLISGWMGRLKLHRTYDQKELLRRAAINLRQGVVTWPEPLKIVSKPRTLRGNVCPSGAKLPTRMRKRPAKQIRVRRAIQKRPATGVCQ